MRLLGARAHALIAAGGDPHLHGRRPAIDAAYLAICGVITILDSLVDDARIPPAATGLHRLYEPGELLAGGCARSPGRRCSARTKPHTASTTR